MGNFNRGGGGGGFRGGGFRREFNEPRQRHKAICAECGQECTVPFEPKEGRAVYCTACFSKRKGF